MYSNETILNNLRGRLATRLLVVALMISALPCTAKDRTPDEVRADIRKMAEETLRDLYQAKPSARQAIDSAAGYAVFDNMGVHILLVSTAHGHGIAVNQKTGQETFMKMLSGGAGLGVGVKDYRAIFVFETSDAFNKFLDSGWEAGTQADAAAKTSSNGGAYAGAIALSPGVWVYQITKKGLALQFTLQGTKYYKNAALNEN
jgi:lipid-binding SYLF domain-containing protein